MKCDWREAGVALVSSGMDRIRYGIKREQSSSNITLASKSLQEKRHFYLKKLEFER